VKNRGRKQFLYFLQEMVSTPKLETDEMPRVIKIGVIKVGCIGTIPLIEFLLDERAERTDIDVRVAGTGAKLGSEQCLEAASSIIKQTSDLVLLIGPAQQAPGPMEARRLLAEAKIPTIVISDSPTKKIVKDLEASGFGYVIITADSMIGARREFLDPAEMALYNSDVIRVLAATGVFNLLINELEAIIQSLKCGKKPSLPHTIVDKEKAVEASGFRNPYARAKAVAAYEIASCVAELNARACFKTQEWTEYVPLTAAGHEMMRTAAKLADEARELEKSGDTVMRKPHSKDGSLGVKRALIEKPKKG
jgi:methylenetetrahydromethanopterin dehydrogenase